MNRITLCLLISQMVDLIAASDNYFKAPDQVSCPISQRVTDISECKLAAEKSGLNYYGDYFVIDRPPGCYYFRTQVYFNKNLEAKPSSVTWFGLGICKGQWRKITFDQLGCWKDSMPRTMIPLEKTASILNGNYKIRLEPVKKCGDVAWSLGYKIFALQDGGQCFGTSSLEEYKNYGTSDACLDDGKGGPLANAVYMIRTGETIDNSG